MLSVILGVCGVQKGKKKKKNVAALTPVEAAL